MQSIQADLLNLQLSLTMKPMLRNFGNLDHIRMVSGLADKLIGLMSRVRREPAEIPVAEFDAEWIGYSGDGEVPVLLYLPGGAFVMRTPNFHSAMVARLCKQSGARALMTLYRLAPEHPFPACLEDAVLAYEWLLQQGMAPERIAIAGDSAGGGLPRPACGYMLSPLLDVNDSAASRWKNALSDSALPAPWARALNPRPLYLGENDPDDPIVSPVNGDFHDLPPLYVQVSDSEMLLDDSLRGLTGISPLYSGCGLMFYASSYCDRVGITFTSDRDMMPDPEVMRECLEEAIDQLRRYLQADRNRRQRDMRARLSGRDTFQLALETHRHYMHTFKVAILDPSTDPEGWSFERYREDFSRRIHHLPWMRWRYLSTPLGLNYPIWVDDPEFNLDYHLRRVVCPGGGDQRSLCEFMSSVYAYQLDRSRPLWLNWVVEGLEGGKVAHVALVHHAYVDGLGASRAMEQLYTYEPGWMQEPAPPWQPEEMPSWGARLWWGMRDLPGVLAAGMPTAVKGIPAKRRLDREWTAQGRAAHPEPADAPQTPLNRPVSAGRSFVCQKMPLADFKAISKGMRVTINDVFLSCVAAALRRYLQGLDYDVDRKPLVAGVPFGLKRPPGKEYLGNYSTKDCAWLHTEIEDPVERLRACSRSASEMKAHLAAVQDAGADIGSVVDVLPPVALSLMGRSTRKASAKSGESLFGNVVVSNVPGPRERLFLGGYTLDNWFSIGQIFDGANINFTLWSYCGNANLCILADSQVVPDGWVLFDYFVDEVKTLVALTPGEVSA